MLNSAIYSWGQPVAFERVPFLDVISFSTSTNISLNLLVEFAMTFFAAFFWCLAPFNQATPNNTLRLQVFGLKAVLVMWYFNWICNISRHCDLTIGGKTWDCFGQKQFWLSYTGVVFMLDALEGHHLLDDPAFLVW